MAGSSSHLRKGVSGSVCMTAWVITFALRIAFAYCLLPTAYCLLQLRARSHRFPPRHAGVVWIAAGSAIGFLPSPTGRGAGERARSVWSALTCQRFGMRRLVTAMLTIAGGGRDKSRPMKAVTSYRTPNSPHSSDSATTSALPSCRRYLIL